MNEVVERLKNYLNGYKSQYDYLDDNGSEYCLDDDIKQLLGIMQTLQQENEELKKQLNEKIVLEMKLKEELEDKRKEYQETYKDVREEIKDYKNQQKEFIEWLENLVVSELDVFTEIRICDVLSKYKEIVGGKK